MTTEYVTGWSHDTATDRRTGRPMERRTPHAIPAGGTLPVQAACGADVHEVGGPAFPPTRSLVSGQDPCPACLAGVGGR